MVKVRNEKEKIPKLQAGKYPHECLQIYVLYQFPGQYVLAQHIKGTTLCSKHYTITLLTWLDYLYIVSMSSMVAINISLCASIECTEAALFIVVSAAPIVRDHGPDLVPVCV